MKKVTKRFEAPIVRGNVKLSDGPPSYDDRELVDAIKALIEMNHQMPFDLCGEQRAFHLPRIQKAWPHFAKLFPKQFVAAMEKAVDAYGDKLMT